MHFRVRQNVVQLVRTTYDPATKKPKASVVGRMPLDAPALTQSLRQVLSPSELREAEAWIAKHGRLQLLREEFAALTLAENLSRAERWLGRNAELVSAPAVIGDFLPALQQLRRALRKRGYL